MNWKKDNENPKMELSNLKVMHMKVVNSLSPETDQSDMESDIIVEDRNQLRIRLNYTKEEFKKLTQKIRKLRFAAECYGV